MDDGFMWPNYPKIHHTNKNTGVMVENKYEEYSSVILKHLGGNTALHSLIFNNTVKSHILVNAWSTPPHLVCRNTPNPLRNSKYNCTML